MDEIARAQAQATEQVERTIGLLKRAQRANREAVQGLRQLQVNLFGISVDTVDELNMENTKAEGGHGAER